jgi:hypothetical protein
MGNGMFKYRLVDKHSLILYSGILPPIKPSAPIMETM